MPKVKEVLTTIEDEVVFMVNPEAHFVSQVKYGANRTPFKVLKNDKEVDNMNKVVQSVLVKNDLPDDVVAKALEGIDKREPKEFSTFTAYRQVSLGKVEKESLVVVKHDDVEGIFFVLGDLQKDTTEHGTLQIDVKEAVDYATMDNLYTELYAMADIVGGAMRQENAEVDFRKSTILKAIDNFRTFAEVVLENLSDEKLAKAINPEDHPTLVFPLVKEVKTETDEEKAKREKDEKDAEEKAEAEKKAKEEAEKEKEKGGVPFDSFVDKFNESLNTFGEKIVAAITSVSEKMATDSKGISESLEKVGEEVDNLKNTALTAKSELDEEEVNKGERKDIWKGTILSVSK